MYVHVQDSLLNAQRKPSEGSFCLVPSIKAVRSLLPSYSTRGDGSRIISERGCWMWFELARVWLQSLDFHDPHTTMQIVKGYCMECPF